MPLRHPARLRGWRACLLAALAGLLLLAQTQGLVHGVVHGGLPGTAHHEATAPEDSWPLRLFVSHDDDASCRLYDQCSHADALPGPSTAPSAWLPAFLAPITALGTAPTLSAARPRARGPPTSR